MTCILRGRRSIWWGWRVTWLAPRIGNEVSYVTQIIDDIHFAWQGQYLVRLEGDFTCSTHWKWGFICDADHWWHAFCEAGAVFAEFEGWLFVTGAALRDILGDSRSAKCCILQYKIVSKMGRVRSPKRRVRDDDFYRRIILGYRRISSDYPRIVLFYWRKHSGSIRWNLELQDFVAGAVFGEVRGWLYLLHALEMRFHMWRRSLMTFILRGQAQYLVRLEGWLDLLHALEMRFHMWRRSLMTFILRGRRSIWWGWRVTLLAPRIGNEVSYVTQIIDDMHFAWQAQYLLSLEGWLYLLHGMEMTFHMRCGWTMRFILRGRGRVWWGWRVTFTCSTHWKWRFICDADEGCLSILRGRSSICWVWMVTLLAPRNGNDVSLYFVTMENASPVQDGIPKHRVSSTLS